MILAKEISAKFAVAAVAVAMIFSAYAAPAQAQSTEDLQQMINDLLAQVAGLQAQLGQGGSTGGDMMSSSVCPYTWTRDLSSGSEGADVMKLQQFLNSNADTRVAATGAGSAGNETMYYGPATAAAVSKFQVAYRADILTPAGLVNPTGYFGPSTRAKANANCVAAPAGGDDMGGDDMGGDDMDDDKGSMTLSGEASLGDTDLDSEESSLEEGDEDVAVASFTMEFEDGDAEVSRMDVTLKAGTPSVGSQDETDPWDVFETVSLWVDGDKVAEMDADDEDEYLDEDDGELRFSDLGIIAEEDDELEVMIAVTLQNNLDGVTDTDEENWEVDVTSLRFFDADDVATTENISVSAVDFDIEKEGAEEELSVSLASNNPDATDIIVDTDNDTNGVTIMVADVEAEGNDLEINNATVRIDTTGASTTDVVDEVYLILDGQEFEAEAISLSTAGGVAAKGEFTKSASRYVDNDVSDDAVWYVFDIDGDVVIDEDEEVEAEVVVDFRDTDDGNRYNNGTTIQARITSTEIDTWDAEGADDLGASKLTGTAVGDEHILVAEGIVVPVDGFTASEETLGDNDNIGEFTLEFEVTAVEGDFYITNDATSTALAPTTGVGYTVDGGTAVVTDSLTSTADEDTVNVFTVREGETETFTLVVTVDPAAAGTFRVQLDEVHYTENADGTTSTVQYDVTPVTDFRTSPQSINN